jgi:DNA (cytosine-5)-methyltransferase 1
MHELALFAGAGGGILGGKLLGWTTVCAVEWNEYARSVLIARQNDGSLAPFPIWDDVRTFDGRPWRGLVDVVSGGFPCQDISSAGKGAGIDGSRSGLWGEMARIIREVGPRYVLVENSPMLTSRGLGRVVGDLAEMGYDAQWGVLGADDAGAPHRRDRIWIVAHAAQLGRGARRTRRPDPSSARKSELALSPVANASGGRCDRAEGREVELARGTQTICAGKTLADPTSERCGEARQHQPDEPAQRPARCGAAVADAECIGCGQVVAPIAGGTPSEGTASEAEHCGGAGGRPWWESEPDVGRVADGVAARVDRLRCLGNGQVPAVVRLAWNLLQPLEGQGGRVEHPNVRAVSHEEGD